MSKKAYIKTFGCQMNVHDSEKMAGILRQEGYEIATDQQEADLIVLNTCSVRDKAEQKFFSDLGRLKGDRNGPKPSRKIAVTGCIAQHMGQEIIRRAPHVDMVIGPQNYHKLAGMLRDSEEEGGSNISVEENPDLAEMELPALRTEGPRAWVSIMYGCNNFCTYCIVPFTRGREKSRPANAIIKEIEGLVRQGYKEVTLLGQNVNSYKDGEMDFPRLLKPLDSLDGIERIRFVTSHPRDLSEGLVTAMAELDSVCEHLHLPLQSGSSDVLRAMNRKYNYEDYMHKLNMLRGAVPGIAITADIIAGFPGESEEDHQCTLNALREIRYDGIYAFRYSERKGTRAAEMENAVPEKVRLRRLQEILDIQEDITLETNQKLQDSVQEIMVEGPSASNADMLSGRTRTNKIVHFRAVNDVRPGDIISLTITAAHKHSLVGAIEGKTPCA